MMTFKSKKLRAVFFKGLILLPISLFLSSFEREYPPYVLAEKTLILEFVKIDQESKTPIYQLYNGKQTHAFELRSRYQNTGGLNPDVILLLDEHGATNTLHHQGNGIYQRYSH